jgi:hypothetical protein
VDPSILVHLKAAPVEADPFSVETLRSGNPALGIFLDEGDLVREAERARRMPAFEAAYRNLRLNQRVDASTENRLCTAAVWKAYLSALGGREQKFLTAGTAPSADALLAKVMEQLPRRLNSDERLEVKNQAWLDIRLWDLTPANARSRIAGYVRRFVLDDRYGAMTADHL